MSLPITERQQVALKWVMAGLTMRQAAARMGVTESTVACLVNSAEVRLGYRVERRAQGRRKGCTPSGAALDSMRTAAQRMRAVDERIAGKGRCGCGLLLPCECLLPLEYFATSRHAID